MVPFVFLLLIVALYAYLIMRIYQHGQRKWLWMIGVAIIIKLSTIVYLLLKAPINT